MFVRPCLRFSALGCVYQALVVFSTPELCLSDLGCVSDPEILSCVIQALVVFSRPQLRLSDLGCVSEILVVFFRP